MTDDIESHIPNDEGPARSRYTSFILRCWTDSEEQVHARLIAVHTGVSHPLADLTGLPDLIHQLVIGTIPLTPNEDTKLQTSSPKSQVPNKEEAE